ncbi:MAG: aminotransferase class V-fold PLP-dependent enzyme [Gemmatimonadetes bacterium]|nr:aminotransferase class V-fold PLP-dependent enzyme [Gemmatimonadota bacterium]MDA1104553.1 aminotransferase class V-fold PLP-dependent enzyme [Gemmatimonadota bacterium]
MTWNRRTFLKATGAAGLAASTVGLDPSRVEAAPNRSVARSDDPLGIRHQFPVTRELAYLNTASMGPIPVPVRDALAAYAEERMMYRDPGSLRRSLDRARARFAGLFGADTDEIALLYSTSDGENLVANAIDWRPGDNVVIDELHFTTAFVVFRELEKRAGIELRIVPSVEGRARPEDYEARTDARTRLISVAWVSNRNGLRHDLPTLAEIAHARGGYLFADGIQAFGTFPTDLHAEGVDFACGNGYKWLFADYGCSPFYVRREHLEWLSPDRFGHGQVAGAMSDHRYTLQPDARKFEYANASHAAVAAMDASLGFIGEVGLERIAQHTQGLAADLRSELAGMGMDLFTPADNPSPIVSFYHGLDPETLAAALADDGVRFTFQEEGRLMRTAIAMFNNREDIDRLLAVVARMV